MKTIDPTKTALIIQDLQNDIIMPGGVFCKEPSPAEHAKKQNVVAHAIRIIIIGS